jgi:hypothetical protein
MYLRNLIEFLQLFKPIQNTEKIKPALGRPSPQGHRPNGAAARLALLAIRPSGPVRVAHPLGLVAHSRRTGEPWRTAAPAGCRRVGGATGCRVAWRTGRPHGGVEGDREWATGRSLHELQRRWNKGAGRKITARSKQRRERGEWGPDHGARLKGEGVLVEWWIGGPGSQHRPRIVGDGRRTAGVCATRDRGGKGRGASTRGPLWAR